MVVNAHADNTLGPFLADHVFIEPLENLAWSTRQAVRYGCDRRLIIGDDLMAPVYTLVADEYL
jgi:hypothetical protein